ncbi:MAG: hypothetical protein QXO60_02160 [Candidatus Micrarchaeia archaeon]
MEKEKILAVAVFLLILLNIYQFNRYNSLRELHLNYVENATSNIEKLNSEKQELITSLQSALEKNENLKRKLNEAEANYSQLQNEYQMLTQNYTLLGSRYEQLKDEANALLAKLDEYSQKINESMSWFSQNSNIEKMNNNLKTSLVSDLKTECYKIILDECRIKTACFYLVNDEFYGLRYISDTSLYNREDKLSSLDEFIANKGGDCEDYSLFFKAEMNNVLSKCSNKKIIIESYMPIENGNRYFINNRDTWFIRDVEAKELKPGNIYPYVVCYLTEPLLGHCVVAFSQYKINNSSQINLLNGAELIEPQDGSYMGEIGKEIKLPVFKNGINELMIVISDNDMYSFENGEWIGYADFILSIDNMKKELQEYLK